MTGPVAKLDADRLAARVREHTGVDLLVEGLCEGGQVGAAYVRWPDGHRGVLSWQPGTAVERTRSIARMIEFARGAGIPAPWYELIVDLGEEIAIVQELLPGRKPGQIDVPLIEELLAVLSRMYGVLDGLDDIAPVDLHLRESGPGFCIHETLQEYDARTRRLLGWIRAVGESVPRTMSGADLVHTDYQPENVLITDGGRGTSLRRGRNGHGVISGVVDWDGAGRGDARFALATMRFAGPPDALEPAVVRRLDAAIDEALTPEELQPYWASMSLRMVDWSIRHFTAGETEKWVTLAESRLD